MNEIGVRPLGLPFFYIESLDLDEPTPRLKIEGEDVRHLSGSLRVRRGEEVTVCDGKGLIYQTRVLSQGRDLIELDVISCSRVGEVVPRIELFQALIPPARLEDCIRLAVEAGVNEIIPFKCKRSIDPSPEKLSKLLERWNKIARESAKTSRRCRLSLVSSFLKWEDLLNRVSDSETPLILWEKEERLILRDALIEDPPSQLVLVAGPKGGFEEEEIEELVSAGAKPVSLGEANFKSQTAGPLAAFFVRQHYGDSHKMEKILGDRDR